MKDDSFVGMSGQSMGGSGGGSKSTAGLRKTLVAGGAILLAAYAAYLISPEHGAGILLGVVISVGLGVVFLSIVAGIGGHFDARKVLNGAIALTAGGILFSFLPIFGLILSFFLLIAVFDYLGFEAMTSLFIALLVYFGPALLILFLFL